MAVPRSPNVTLPSTVEERPSTPSHDGLVRLTLRYISRLLGAAALLACLIAAAVILVVPGAAAATDDRPASLDFPRALTGPVAEHVSAVVLFDRPSEFVTRLAVKDVPPQAIGAAYRDRTLDLCAERDPICARRLRGQ